MPTCLARRTVPWAGYGDVLQRRTSQETPFGWPMALDQVARKEAWRREHVSSWNDGTLDYTLLSGPPSFPRRRKTFGTQKFSAACPAWC
jgi:hypothetical protein